MRDIARNSLPVSRYISQSSGTCGSYMSWTNDRIVRLVTAHNGSCYNVSSQGSALLKKVALFISSHVVSRLTFH